MFASGIECPKGATMSTSNYTNLSDRDLLARRDRASRSCQHQNDVFSASRMILLTVVWGVAAMAISFLWKLMSDGGFWGKWWLLMVPAAAVITLRLILRFYPEHRYKQLQSEIMLRPHLQIEPGEIHQIARAIQDEQEARDQAIRDAGGVPASDMEAARRHAMNVMHWEYWETGLPVNEGDVLYMARRDNVIP
jgi:hypothetical protein